MKVKDLFKIITEKTEDALKKEKTNETKPAQTADKKQGCGSCSGRKK